LPQGRTAEHFAVADPRQAFGKRLRELRLQAGFSQEELAAKADLHWTYVGGIERGERNPGLVNITRLAKALGAPAAALFEPPGEIVGRRRRRRR
jgi:transcriptional regulator with XRE-family HTH domain